MCKKISILLLILPLFIFLEMPSAQQPEKLSFPVTLHTLRNGLKVILSEDHSLPLVSVAVAYHAGSINEEPGKSGLAYLLENLMFQGSENIGRMQHIGFIRRIGGLLNATTTTDQTLFSQTVPSNQLALVLWLESDRMNSLDINASNVARVRNSLIEEIRQRKIANPYLECSVYFDQYLFSDFAHSHPIFGREADLREITLEDVKKFYATYYRPNNAVLAISGNIDKSNTMKLVRRFFETIPKGEDIDLPPSAQPSDKKAIDKTYEDSLASLPAFYLGYQIAPPHSKDYYPLKIIEYLLLRGETSRLNKKLIKKIRIAYELSGGIEERRDVAAFKVFVVSTNETMLERSKKAVFSEIARLKTGIISEKEMRKSKNMFRIDYIKQYSTYEDKAIFLAESYLSQNNVENVSEELNKYLSVKPPEIAGAMNKYFAQENILLHVKAR